MFDRDSLIKRALETGWPFVAGLMAEVRGSLTAPGEGAVPRAVYYASLRTLRALESLVRRMLYLMSPELEVSWTPPAPRASAMDHLDQLWTLYGPTRPAPRVRPRRESSPCSTR